MLMEQFFALSQDVKLDEKNRLCARRMFEHERRLALCILMKEFKSDFKPDAQIIDVEYMNNMYKTYQDNA